MKLNIGKLFHRCPSESPFWLIMLRLPILAACPPLCYCRCHRHPDNSPSTPIQVPNVATALTTVLCHCILLRLRHRSSPAWSWPTCHLFRRPLPLFFPAVSPTSSTYLCQQSKFSNGNICTLYNVYNLCSHPSSSLARPSLYQLSSFWPSSPSFPLHSKQATVDVSFCKMKPMPDCPAFKDSHCRSW